MQLSQGLDRQPLSPEGAPPLVDRQLSRASLAHGCIRGILRVVATSVNPCCDPPGLFVRPVLREAEAGR